ncbi:MAG TPA: arginine--tRNA ligase [Thermoplasmata archaeon]|nr:arginine--tRNA ligase [Thermoplasmata archaeon]
MTNPPSNGTDPWAPWTTAAVAGLVDAARARGAPTDPAAVDALLELGAGSGRDLAYPTHRLAGHARLPVEELAAGLAAAFPRSPAFRAVRADGAYVNFEIDPAELIRATLSLALGRGERYGHGEPTGETVCVEHTSANPTGPFHIGRVRNAIIGDSLARAIRAAGPSVTTQYYIDDMGRQSTMITWLWTRPVAEWPEPVRAAAGADRPDEKPDHRRGRPYPALSARVKDDPETARSIAELVRQIEEGHAPPEHLALAREVLGGMLASLGRLGIGFDEFVWESQFVRDGSVARVLERLRAAPHAVREENGAWSVDATTYGLPKESDRVVVQRADGTSLYVTRDIAYHLAKFSRFARVVDVLGQDHQLHARTLDALLTELGETRRPTYVVYQDLTTPEGGRMSTRGGRAVWLDDLLAEARERARVEVLKRRDDLATAEVDAISEAVATGAIRYHVVRIAPEKPVKFRWEEALSFEGRSGPFVQYSYARASSVLRKGDAAAPPYPFDAAQLAGEEELALARVLSRFPRTVAYVARSAHVHALAGYAHEVADRFNRFYHAVPVLTGGEARASRLALVAAVRQTLGNALRLLGIAPLESM